MYNPNRLEWHLGDNANLEPRKVLCGLVVRQASLLTICSIVLLLLSPRAKTTEHLAGFLHLADRVTRVTLPALHGVTSQETPTAGHTP